MLKTYPRYNPAKNGVLKQYQGIKRQGKCIVRIMHYGARKVAVKIWRTSYGPKSSFYHLLPEGTEYGTGQFIVPNEIWEDIKKVAVAKSFRMNF